MRENFPSECRFVLELLGQMYGYDAEARERGLTPDERLQLHQQRRRPVTLLPRITASPCAERGLLTSPVACILGSGFALDHSGKDLSQFSVSIHR
jgi:hypothetical protein